MPLAKLRPKAEKGQALVQFALALLFVFLFVAAFIDVVVYFWMEASLRFAASEGIRLAIYCNDAARTDRDLQVAQRVATVVDRMYGGDSRALRITELSAPVSPGNLLAITLEYDLRLPFRLSWPRSSNWTDTILLTASAAGVADKRPGQRDCVPPPQLRADVTP